MAGKPIQLPLRVLIVAENASVRLGGEAILPFHYFRLLRARSVDTHLIVHARVRDELLALFPTDHDRLHFVEDQKLQKLLYRLGSFFPHRLAEATFGLATQMLTQKAQRRVVKTLLRPGPEAYQDRSGEALPRPAFRVYAPWIVIHQPIPVSPRFPSLLTVPGVPLVVGPLNGGMEYPPAFRSDESTFSRLAIAFGRSLANVANSLFPGKRNASIVLVANRRTRAALPGGIRGRVIELPENGVDLTQWTAPPSAMQDPNRFLFIGRLVDWKSLDIALEALAQVPEATLEIIGDGDMRTHWEAFATQHCLGSRVVFSGWKPQAECAQRLAASCALLLPSLYECGGAVVLEAMAMARPVIATAWGGPADYLDATCGFLIEPTSRAALVSGFAQAMRTLIASPALRESMGTAGQARLREHFDWNRKIDAMLGIYAQALHPGSTPSSSSKT